jgi:osomolarity two-component system, sensor histidine kinase SLN1
MRIGIREQLAALGLIVVLVGLAVVSIPTWLYVHDFITQVKTEGLAETASLKAAELSSHLILLQSTCSSITTRLIIQQALQSFRANGTLSSSQKSFAVCLPAN